MKFKIFEIFLIFECAADEILTASWNGKDFEDLASHLGSITNSLTQLGEQHLTYPKLIL
ncbi:MAG: hypothetical protein AAF915_18230 [Cyanobacteria bacterium P01_D01_bin.50]